MENQGFFTMGFGNDDIPVVATAVHDGHLLSPDLISISGLSAADRLREEDPFTGLWTKIVDKRIVGHYSRFEVDLNRPRDKAVYLEPADAWGLNVWKTRPTKELHDRALAKYDAFYREVESAIRVLLTRFDRVVVYDLHTYNHRRQGPEGPEADPETNPEVNIGTGTMDRSLWAPVVDRFIEDLRSFDFLGRHLDVRENIKFRGGNFSRWIHETFPETVCSIAVEFKKFFMDEWSGEPNKQLDTIPVAVASTIPGVIGVLKKTG